MHVILLYYSLCLHLIQVLPNFTTPNNNIINSKSLLLCNSMYEISFMATQNYTYTPYSSE